MMYITHLEANPIEQIFIIRYVRKSLRDFAACGQEHAIGHFPYQIKSAINDVMACAEMAHIIFALWTAVTRFLPLA